MQTIRRPYTLNGGESRPLLESLSLLQADTQERAQRVIETGAAALRYAVIVAAYAAMARKERASK